MTPATNESPRLQPKRFTTIQETEPMSTEIVPFHFEGVEVRTAIIDAGPWWILSDVARALAVGNASDLAARLDEDEKGVAVIDTPGGAQSVRIINEAGLYSVILRSDKPEAKRFKRWLTHEVIPTIRTTGSYSTAPALTEDQIVQQALTILVAKTATLEAAVAELEPRAEAWDELAGAKGDFSVGEAAKMLARAGVPTGPQRLFDQLGDMHWTFRNGHGAWVPFATIVDMGYLASKPMSHEHPKTHVRVIDPPQVRVTIKGLDRLRQKLQLSAQQAEAA